MAISSWNAGIIRPVAVAPAGPYQDGAASGVWTLDQQAFWQKQGLWPIAGNVAAIGLFGGGSNSSGSNVIQRLIIATSGNSTDFGDLTARRRSSASLSSSTRGIWAGGYNNIAGEVFFNVIDYVTIATTGNATDFGDLYTNALYELAGASSDTRGIIAGGQTGSTDTNVIQYLTIASTGNTVDFGDLTQRRYSFVGGAGSQTRALFAGGVIYSGNTTINIIDYVTIASTGNATDFGDLTLSGKNGAACSNSTRAVFAYGRDGTGVNNNTISYVTIASTGNATDFGDRTVAQEMIAGCASSTLGVFAGGNTNVIDYITFASTGNAVDSGDMFLGQEGMAACSSAHGGL